jgi:hypothetical protein
VKPHPACWLPLVLLACGEEAAQAPAPNVEVSSGPGASESPATPEPPAATGSLSVTISAPAEVEEGTTFDASCAVEGATSSDLRFEWMQASGPEKIVIPRNFAPAVTVRAADALADYEVVLAVRVRSGAETATKEARIRVRADDDAPIPELIAPPSAECGERVALVGQAHNEIRQGVTVEWIQVGEGPRVEIEGRDRLQASFVAPEHEGAYAVEVEMHLRDGVHPDSVEKASIAIECDPRGTPLPPGSTFVIAAEAGVETPLPRGAWEIEGSIELVPRGERPATARIELRAESQAGALELASDGKELSLGTLGLARDPSGAWIVPEWNGGIPFGPWPPGIPLGFLFESDGREVSVRFGPAGARDQWPELPATILLPLGKRPRTFVIEIAGADAKVGTIELRAR